MRHYVRPDEKRLSEGRGHLDYECEIFYLQTHLLVDLSQRPVLPSDFDWLTIYISVLEAWLVHVRGLLLSFRENRGKPHDILFRDYLTDESWDRLRDHLLPDAATEERLGDIGQLLAHISYERERDLLRGVWKLDEYVRVDKRIRTWHAGLDSVRRGWFPRLGEVLKLPPLA